MDIGNLTGRRQYQSDNGVEWARFLPLALLTLLLGAAMAVVLYLLLDAGVYWIIIMPVLAALPVAGLAMLSVIWGRCRNRWIGAALGFTAGLLLYIGYYYVGMISMLGPELRPALAARVEMLPRYIALRARTDRQQETGHSRRQDEAPRPNGTIDVVMNWVLFGGELFCVLFLTTGAAFVCARRAWCPTCRRWLNRELTGLPGGWGSRVVEALNTNALEGIVQAPVAAMTENQPFTVIAVEYCPAARERSLTCPIYISVKEVRKGGGRGAGNKFEYTLGKNLVRRWELNRDEVALLARRMPALVAVKGCPAPPVAARPAGWNAASRRGAWDEAEADAAQIRIDPVPPPSGRILCRRNVILANLIGLLQIAQCFGGVGLGLLGCKIGDFDHAAGHPVAHQTVILAWTLVGLGLALMLSAIIPMFFGITSYANIYLRWLTRRLIGARRDALVQPEDPDAMLIEVVPPENLGRVMLETATDIGYLKIDHGRREILFEGDKERYRIPAAALLECEFGEFTLGHGSGRVTYHYLMLRARNRPADWQMAIRPRQGGGTLMANRRKKRNVLALQEQFAALMAEEKAVTPGRW